MSKEPASLTQMMAAWNETNPARIETCLSSAVTPDVVFVDPKNDVRGRAAFLGMILEFRTRYPKARCVRTSEIDAHHDRARYHWRVIIDENAYLDGMDAVEFDPSGLVRRVDGFFGVLKADTAAI